MYDSAGTAEFFMLVRQCERWLFILSTISRKLQYAEASTAACGGDSGVLRRQCRAEAATALYGVGNSVRQQQCMVAATAACGVGNSGRQQSEK